MIACAADQNFSSSVGIIGSVGVLMGPNFNIAELMEKYGVKQLTITRGKDKDMLSPYREWKPGEDQSLKDLIDYEYSVFTDIVVERRPEMNKNDLINVYGAQVYDPLRAQEYGYIDDGKSSYSQALSQLLEAASITDKYQVIELKILRPVLSDLIEGKLSLFNGKVKHEFPFFSEFPPEFVNCPLYFYYPGFATR